MAFALKVISIFESKRPQCFDSSFSTACLGPKIIFSLPAWLIISYVQYTTKQVTLKPSSTELHASICVF